MARPSSRRLLEADDLLGLGLTLLLVAQAPLWGAVWTAAPLHIVVPSLPGAAIAAGVFAVASTFAGGRPSDTWLGAPLALASVALAALV